MCTRGAGARAPPPRTHRGVRHRQRRNQSCSSVLILWSMVGREVAAVELRLAGHDWAVVLDTRISLTYWYYYTIENYVFMT